MKKNFLFLYFFSLLIFLAGPVWGVGDVPLGLPSVDFPEDNPQSPEKIALGKELFEDKRFSADGTVSCMTCHEPTKGFADGLKVAEGIKKLKGTRNAPTVSNAVYYESQFWDGRRESLEEQAKDPFVNPVEHGLKSHEPILDIIRKDSAYSDKFKKVFGVSPDKITIDHVVMAIASFERTLIHGNSPFDRYLYGKDSNAMSPAAVRGLEIFRTKGRCVDCHRIEQTSSIFTDNKFHNLGVGFSVIEPKLFDIVEKFREAKARGLDVDKAVLDDNKVSELGRFALTLEISDLGRFKTPSIRNVELTAPYMHNGSIDTLEDVIELYDIGGEANPMLDSGIRPLKLTGQEKADLVAFMKALTSPELKNALKNKE